MNQRKFINLLNLYLDGEIDQPDAVALEHEILSNPERRRIYSEYCRIQRATKLVYEQFRLAAEDQSDEGVGTIQQAIQLPQTGNRVAGVEAGRPFRGQLWWGFGTAAAACAALAVSLHFFQVAPMPANAVVAPAPAVQPAAVVATDQNQPEPRKVESFAAPFAPTTRADPYVATQPGAHSDPFALVSFPVTESRQTEVQTTPIMPAGMPVPALHLNAPTPALDLVDPSVESADHDSDLRIFRGHADGQTTTSSSFEPVGYQIRR